MGGNEMTYIINIRARAGGLLSGHNHTVQTAGQVAEKMCGCLFLPMGKIPFDDIKRNYHRRIKDCQMQKNTLSVQGKRIVCRDKTHCLFYPERRCVLCKKRCPPIPLPPAIPHKQGRGGWKVMWNFTLLKYIFTPLMLTFGSVKVNSVTAKMYGYHFLVYGENSTASGSYFYAHLRV